MGSQGFDVEAVGDNVDGAFAAAVASARYEYGFRENTGSIAEKVSHGLEEQTLQEGQDADDLVRTVYYSKRGPTCYLDLGVDENGVHRWRFWGMAEC